MMSFVVLAASCAGDAGTLDEATSSTVAAADRAVGVETTGCGFASGQSGSGIAIGGQLVVTAAHLVAQAEGVSVVTRTGRDYEARPVLIDTRVDLALLYIEELRLSPASLGSAPVGGTGLIVGGSTSGTVPYEVLQVADLTIEEVLGTDRFERGGYQLDAATRRGDSGAGMYDSRGNLIGMVFAVGEDRGTTWATSAVEIERLLEAYAPAAVLECDPATSRMGTP